jgi:hypothetical protein
MIMLTAENYGCVYSVCSEGELYYSPIMTDGTISLEDWEPVDLYECDEFESKDLEEIQDKLIELMKVAGLYFQNA